MSAIMRTAGRFVWLALGIAASAGAQPSVELTVMPALEESSWEGVPSESSGTVSGELAATVPFATGRGHLGYSFAGSTYASGEGWGSFQHRGELAWRFGARTDGATRLHLGAWMLARRNGASWEDPGWAGGGARANLEASPRSGLTLRTGIRGESRVFSAQPAFDQTEADAFGSALVNLPSRTTLIGEARLAGKWYRGAPAIAVAMPTWAAGVDGGLTVRKADSGQGPGGPGGPVVPPSPSPGPSPPSDPGPVTPPSVLPGWPMPEGPTAAGAVSWLVRLAQSLGDRTGLALQYQQRVVFGTPFPTPVLPPPTFLEDGVYDDPFSFDALNLRATLKHAFASGAEVGISSSWERRSYPTTFALDEAGAPYPECVWRAEDLTRMAAWASVPLVQTGAGRLGVDLLASLRLLWRSSNDAAFDVDDRALALGIKVAY